MKTLFREQFIKCREENLNTENGEFLFFKDHPKLPPAFPNKEMLEAIKDEEFRGIQTLKCGKFGGVCSGDNKKCRKLRGFSE